MRSDATCGGEDTNSVYVCGIGERGHWCQNCGKVVLN